MDLRLEHLVAGVRETADGPLDRVTTAALVKDQLELVGDDLLDRFVTEAREAGCSWTQIGEALGVTRQAAQQRHSALADRLVAGLDDGRFKRFTGRARTALGNAEAAAAARNHTYVGTEHVLEGLFAAADDNLAVQALRRLGVERAAVERLVDERAGRAGGGPRAGGRTPLTPLAKQALERAVGEALALGHNYVGTEHVLLALHRVDDGLAHGILAELGVGYDDLRAAVVALLAGRGRPDRRLSPR